MDDRWYCFFIKLDENELIMRGKPCNKRKRYICGKGNVYTIITFSRIAIVNTLIFARPMRFNS